MICPEKMFDNENLRNKLKKKKKKKKKWNI
jgi:hypothetical protein